MQRLMEAGKQYIKKMSIWDMALLKFCLCAAGIMLGLAIPKKCRERAGVAAAVVFAVTYVILMVPFLKLFQNMKDT